MKSRLIGSVLALLLMFFEVDLSYLKVTISNSLEFCE